MARSLAGRRHRDLPRGSVRLLRGRVASQNDAAKKGTIDYFEQVQPILEARCYGCHASAKTKGKLRLDDRASAFKGGRGDGPAIIPGKRDGSALLLRIRSQEDSERMPPKGDPLSSKEARLLETWIHEGAAWPEVKTGVTTLTPLTDDLTFLRRVTLDTVGVVPTPAEIEACQKDTSLQRRARIIDRLLDDPRWADHWMGYWQDVLAEK